MDIMNLLSKIVSSVNDVLWSSLLIFLLVGTGVFFTFKFRFIQVRKFGAAWKTMFSGISFGKNKEQGAGLSSFQALTTAIAAQVGTGNIAGGATAIMAGGPGAVFWMWVSAFFGMATIYAEAVLAQKTRVLKDGEYLGGPVYYIRARFQGAFGKFLAGFFSVAIILALGFMGNMVQSNSIASSFQGAFGIPPLVMGVIVGIVAFMIFVGGIKRIGSVTEKIVPVMAIVYVIGSLIIIIMNYRNLGPALRSIFIGAFNPTAVLGGAAGIGVQQAVRYGIARGLFSNEAGMGSTPHAHATANVKTPEDQGLIAMVGVFIDTFIVLTMTAMVILVTRANLDTKLTGAPLAQWGYNNAFGRFGDYFVAVCMLFFAFTTIIGWYYFGEVNFRSLFGSKYVKVYAIIVVLCVILGATLKVDLVWDASDMFNGLMVLPNLLALLACSIGSNAILKRTI